MTLASIDQLVASGQLVTAAEQLETMLAQGKGTVAAYLKLAGLRRALKQPHRALEAVHQALVLAPLDFVALTMRAGLLERLGEAGAAEAWAEAIAQKPQGALPPPLAAAIEAGVRFHDSWTIAREARLAAAASAARARADADEVGRIARFSSNILRRTRTYHSEPTHFAFPGLVEREFHPRSQFPWLAALESETAAIRQEALGLLQSDAASEPYIQYADHEALAQWRPLNRNRDWSALHLLRHGEPVAAHAQRAPRTMAALQSLGQRRVPGTSPNAMFSLLAPRTAIPPHVGVDNTRLVCHLPLVVPDRCWFRVGSEKRLWREGEALVFDDTIEHEACNPSDRLRIVLIFDVWHPGLSPVEREAVAAMIAGEGAPTQL